MPFYTLSQHFILHLGMQQSIRRLENYTTSASCDTVIFKSGANQPGQEQSAVQLSMVPLISVAVILSVQHNGFTGWVLTW